MKQFWLSLGLLALTGCSLTGDTNYFGAAQTQPGPFVWGDIQTAPDQAQADWNWTATDNFIQQAQQTHLPFVITVWPYALWDQATCHGDRSTVPTLFSHQFIAPYVPCDSAAYTTWLTALVQRYHGQVISWEIMHQPDVQAPPLANYIGTSADYIDLFVRTAAAIHAVDNQALVLNGSMSGDTTSSITFWGPILQQPTVAGWDITAVALTDMDQWPGVQSWLQRYSRNAPIWILSSPEQQIVTGADKVFYTVKP